MIANITTNCESLTDAGLAIFDMDGTVIDSIDDLTDAVNRARKRFSLAPLDRLRVRQAVGDGLNALALRTMPDEETSASPNEKFAALLEEYKCRPVSRTSFYPGFPEAFTSLLNAGWKVALLSNKRDEILKRIVAELGIDKYFAAVSGAKEGMPLKPHPDGALSLIADSHYNGDRENIWMIGDAHTDAETAHNAKLKSCLCEYGYGDVSGVKCEIRVASINEWLEYLKITAAPTERRAGL